MDDPYRIYRRPDFVSHAEWIISLRLRLLKGLIPLEHVEWVREQITEHQERQQVVILYNFAELLAAYIPFPIPFIIVYDLCCIGARPTACRCTTKANPQGTLDDPEEGEITLFSDDQAA